MAKFKRILLKLSGESLMGKQSFGIDPVRLGEYAEQIKEVHEMGVQIGIVIGGGNIFRGLSGASKGFDRVKGDQMGMCATVINSLALSSALGALGVKTKVLTAIRMEPIGEFYSKWKAIEAMEAGYVCIFSAGTGSPYFTTDTGSSLRGIEIEADVMLKGTRVDGIYTADPEKDPTAFFVNDMSNYESVTYEGYGPNGTAIIVEALTDNRNRAASNIRSAFTKGGGNVGTPGCVSFMFDNKGQMIVDKEEYTGDADELMMLALDAGADDFNEEEDCYEILTSPEEFDAVNQALADAGVTFASAEVTMIPQTTVDLTSEDDIKKMNRILGLLDEDDDVQNVYHNWDAPAEDDEE